LEYFWPIAIVAVFFSIALLQAQAKVAREKTDAAKQKVLGKHALDELYVSPVDGTSIGFQFAGQKIVLAGKDFDSEYRFDQIASVEVIENGATLTQTNRGSQLLGAAVGGLALGGVGLLVGGMSASSRSRARLRTVALKVVVDDQVRPVHTICFLRWPDAKGIDPDGVIAKPARTAVERVHGLLVTAMRQTVTLSANRCMGQKRAGQFAARGRMGLQGCELARVPQARSLPVVSPPRRGSAKVTTVAFLPQRRSSPRRSADESGAFCDLACNGDNSRGSGRNLHLHEYQPDREICRRPPDWWVTFVGGLQHYSWPNDLGHRKN